MKKEVKATPTPKSPKKTPTQTKGKVKKEEGKEGEKWKWWEESNTRSDGVKWTFLEHKGKI